jgi:tRNA A-37 threonylcarbamoyl transferase component Bud32
MAEEQPGERSWIDEAADRFERAWREGLRPGIEQFLVEVVEPRHSRLLEELLRVERELRVGAGEFPVAAEYQRRFPEHAALVDTIFAQGQSAPPRPTERPKVDRPETDADRGLLIGMLALQNNFIDREALLAAFTIWVADKARPLGQILREQGALDADTYALLEALTRKHLEMHDGDPERSLAALSTSGPVRHDLERIADPDLHASLAHVAADRATEFDPDATRTSDAGQSNSPGGRFRVLRFHRRGGLGEVFVAHDEELHREVALKHIQEEHADDPQNRSRFVVEAEITGRLEHPGIIPIYGLGTYGDGRPFYVMRFIRGNSLKDAIKDFHGVERPGRDPGEQFLELRKLLARFLDVCNAVAYAHSRGVLHRDLKPGNILLGPYGETLVVDWGLAKVIGRPEGSGGAEGTLRPTSAGGSSETMPGLPLGTPAYMSPEQAAGALDRLGPASDVYSLGATLYSLLTGRAPFTDPDRGLVKEQVMGGDFPPPHQVLPGVPAALDAICLKAMALRPEDRHPSPRALAEDLEHWLADEPVSAYREGWPAQAARWSRRHRTLVAALLVLLVTSVVALASGLVLVDRERQRTLEERSQAFKERAVAVGERVKADQERAKAEAARADAGREAAQAERARRVADQEKTKAEAAKAEATKAALVSFRQTADASMATARMLRYATNQLGPQRQALEYVRTASRARLQASSLAAGDPGREESRHWEERTEPMRTEVAYWVTNLEIRRVREVVLDSGPHQDGPARLENWGFTPAMALRDDGHRIALAYQLSGHTIVVVLDDEGNMRRRASFAEIRRTTPPAGRDAPAIPRDGRDAPAIRLGFAGPERVECTLTESTHTLNLADGRVESKPLETKANIPRNEGVIGAILWEDQPSPVPNVPARPASAPIEVSNESFVLNWLPREVTVRARQAGAEPWTLWRTSAIGVEECKYVGFLSDQRGVIYVTGPPSTRVQIADPNDPNAPRPPRPPAYQTFVVDHPPGTGGIMHGSRLFLGDALTGQSREALRESRPDPLMMAMPSSRIELIRLEKFRDGFATLERHFLSDASGRFERALKVVFWGTILPIVPTGRLNAAGPVQALDLSADARLLAGQTNGFVRTWDGGRPLWSVGSSHPLQRDLSRKRGKLLHFGSYGLFEFAAGESLDPVVERSDPQPSDQVRLRTEAFSAVNGRPVGTPPEPGGLVGVSLITSRDLRFAVVVSEDHGTEWTLALWSPRQNRLLKRLGRYAKPRSGGEEPANRLAPAPYFSPEIRWLLMPAPDASGLGVELWRLPEAERVGKARAQPPASSLDLTIDPAEVHAVRIGTQVFDLASCKTLCNLEGASYLGTFGTMPEFILINKNVALGINGDSWSKHVDAWDLTTGKKSTLGATSWSGTHIGRSYFRLHPDGSRLLVHGIIARPVAPGPALVPAQVVPLGPRTSSDSTYRFDLWDVPQRRLIRQFDRPADPGSLMWVWWDRNSFYLPGEPARGPGAGPVGRESDPAVPPSCYSWSDGRELPPPDETLVTYLEPVYHEPVPQSFDEGLISDNMLLRSGGALWRGRDGLRLQVGWDPQRKPLAGSGQIPRVTFFAPDQLFSRMGFLDHQARVFVLPYAALTGDDRRRWPRHTDVWEIQSGRRLMTLPESEYFATTDPTGTWLAAADSTGPGIKVYEVATGRVAHQVKLAGLLGGWTWTGLAWEGSRPLLRLHPRGDRILLIHLGVLYLWDAVADRPVRRVDRPVHFASVDCVAQSSTSGLAASGGGDGVILLWDREKGRFLRDLVGHAGAITSLAFRPDGARLASASRDGHVILWDAGGKACWTYHVGHEPGADRSLVFEPHYSGVLGYYTSHREGETATSLVFDPSGATLFVGTSAGRLHRLDAGMGKVVAVRDVDATGLQLALSPGGTRLAIASAGGKVRTWNLPGDGAEQVWDVGRAVNSLAFLGEDVIATGGQGIDFWDAATGRHLMRQGIDGGPAIAIGFDERAGALHVATKTGDVLILNVGTMNRHLSEMGLGFLPDRGSRTGH